MLSFESSALHAEGRASRGTSVTNPASSLLRACRPASSRRSQCWRSGRRLSRVQAVAASKQKTQKRAPQRKVNKVLKATKWRLFEVRLPVINDPGKDDYNTTEQLCHEVATRINCKDTLLPIEAVTVVRKSFDARVKQRNFVYVVDVDAAAAARAGAAPRFKQGQIERLSEPTLDAEVPNLKQTLLGLPRHDPVVVVGSGPAGLFAALELAQAGLPVVLLERGQPVEKRGRDIGALFVRRKLNQDSNLCYGEGGAGTWSDGKLTTKVGRNSDPVRRVLQTLHHFGAPQSILVSGKPHLGTDRLVRILQGFRQHLTDLGVKICFGTCAENMVVQHDRVTGVQLQGGEVISASAVVLAVGHSSRAMYRALLAHDVALAPKPFALGLRVEHPQALIDGIQYGQEYAAEVRRGKGPVPVADYSLTAQALPDYAQVSSQRAQDAAVIGKPQQANTSTLQNASTTPSSTDDMTHIQQSDAGSSDATHSGNVSSNCNAASTSYSGDTSEQMHQLRRDSGQDASSSDSPSHRQSHNQEEQHVHGRQKGQKAQGQGRRQTGQKAAGQGRVQEEGQRGVYSFCMCPGGQIVPTSTNPEELCINGMSFSRRNSVWANSALVVAIQPSDWEHLEAEHGALAGVALQQQAERLAATRGGGNLVAPVQRVTDFLADHTSTGTLPSSSYRLGVKSAALHDIYSPEVSQALKSALHQFEQRMPGFISDVGLLHGVETRTSSPVRVERGSDFQSPSTRGLYPCGEGAGYAGGIVSAAVDGMRVAHAIMQSSLVC